MDNPMEVKKVTIEEKGAAVNMETGEAKIPAGTSVRSETVSQTKYVLDDTPHNREILAKVFEKNGFHQEAAEIRGQRYESSFATSAKNLVTENTSVLKGLAAVAIGAFTYYVSRKALNLLAKKMGWNLFGNEVVTASGDAQPSNDVPFRGGTSRRMPASSPMASA